jgi:hypothetical protein
MNETVLLKNPVRKRQHDFHLAGTHRRHFGPQRRHDALPRETVANARRDLGLLLRRSAHPIATPLTRLWLSFLTSRFGRFQKDNLALLGCIGRKTREESSDVIDWYLLLA